MSDLQKSAAPGAWKERTPIAWLHGIWKGFAAESPHEFLVLCVVTGFLLLYGLVPLIGGDQLGLVGADEPRYAQIAREMLAQHNEVCTQLHAEMVPHSLTPKAIDDSFHCLIGGTITPILYGKPWLEKPALYYWRAMSFFREFGVSDWSARLPSSSGAFALFFLIFLHMRRFRPGGHLNAALITASSLAVFAFARGASTDMQLAAPFCIGMLGWYAWYETGKKFWLFDLYFFGAEATLAKGPVAPFLALVIILLFAGLRREWSLLRRTIWWPGILLYIVMVLPWYIAVQWKNPTFYRLFFLEHNLERFATNRYQHHQPFWFYFAVLILGLMPWTILSLRALVDSIDVSIAEWKVRHNPQRYLGHSRAGDAFPEFLVLWALFPIVFFSFSGSKLPGYILPSIPPLTILTADYLHRNRRDGLPNWLVWSHAAVCAILVFVLILAPQHMKYETLVPSAQWLLIAGGSALVIGAAVFLIIRRWGVPQLVNATFIPIVVALVFLLGFHGKDLDLNYSARPLAREIQRLAPNEETLAVYEVRRDLDYGLAFYRNTPTVHYDAEDCPASVPAEEHVLVIPTKDMAELNQCLADRIYKPLFLYDTQGLEVYKVYARQ
ncbi:MAG: glycosyltransferase family 39 protein [Edaphobacter sp.]|uniref:ArnT family glycosyltransferase n=1 Tax=Edaphobacter sp. TaxID=1934404 RepID=UPI0029810E75|nr:glycosyltransferase family 39 protein [Edaphobacter sp.]MDW5267976.1 glycosyltransferase family 39 protein [Edaphobacter sp.]